VVIFDGPNDELGLDALKLLDHLFKAMTFKQRLKVVNDSSSLEKMYSVVEWVYTYNKFIDIKQCKFLMKHVTEALMNGPNSKWIQTA
jgi:hypothetical protein